MLGHWVPLMMVFKPLVALLLRQCNARLSALLFLREPLLDLLVEVRSIRSMTLGIWMIRGVDPKKTVVRNVNLVSLLTTPSARLVVPTLHGRQMRIARRSVLQNPSPTVMLRRCQLRVTSATPEAPALISWTTVCSVGRAQISPRNTRPLTALLNLQSAASVRMISLLAGSARTTLMSSGSGTPSAGEVGLDTLRRWTGETTNT